MTLRALGRGFWIGLVGSIVLPAALLSSESFSAPPPQEQKPHAVLTRAAKNLKELPSHVEIVYELKGLISGKQIHRWQRKDHRYTLETSSEATGLAGIFLSSKMTQKSAGHIGERGLIPERYEMLRLSGKREILVFNYAASSIEVKRIDAKKNTRTSELSLPTGTQDPLSSLYQLAMTAQSGGEGLIVIAGTKRVKGYPYRVLGNETQDLPLGKLSTLHVTRTDDSGSGAVHLWLSPEKKFLPVKISYSDEDGREWILLATSITLK